MRMKWMLFLVLLGLLSGPLWAQDPESFAEMSLEDLMRVSIVVSTGTAKTLSEAPGVVSVITAEQIEAMGAVTLAEVLETIPGINTYLGVNIEQQTNYSIRGIRSLGNTQFLFLLDGIPITQLQHGGQPFCFQYPVEAIARVEVMRGPGSAVYGADAFAGLVNIITKSGKDIDGTVIGARGGSFGFRNAWLQYGATSGGWNISFSGEWQQADGDDDRLILSDLQSGIFDPIFGISASHAPGPLNTHYDMKNFHLGLQRNAWTVRLWGLEDKGRGTRVGASGALDPEGYTDNEAFLVDVMHEMEISNDWSISNRLSYMYQNGSAFMHIFPEGSVFPIDADGNIALISQPVGVTFFPDGVIAHPGTKEYNYLYDFVALYQGAENHRVRAAVGYSSHEIKGYERRNYGPGILDLGTNGGALPPISTGDLTVTTDTPYIYIRDLPARDHWYASLQDEWKLSESWEATLGVRYDNYSDFGDTLNPRLALVWSGVDDFIVKVLYGTAYRAPSFAEIGFQNNPLAQGNPDLEPEEVRTAELVFDWQPNARVRTVLDIFQSDIKGLIDWTQLGGGFGVAQNVRDQKSYGFELELFWDATDRFRVQGNYAYQHSEDKATDLKVGMIPSEMVYLSFHYRPVDNWWINTRLKWIGDMERMPGDPRPPLDGHTRVDLTAGCKKLGEHFGLIASIRNVFDEDGFDPSLEASVPGDLPIEGRRYLLELNVRF